MKVQKVAVVGAGTMGGEIAHAITSANLPVVLKDVDQRFVDIGLERAATLRNKLVEKGKLDPAESDRLATLIQGAVDYDAFGDVDLVIEAVPEKLAIKQAVFAELDAATPGHAVLATNTSALSIDDIAAATVRPDKVVGLHFFYPAAVMRLVEVVEGSATSRKTILTTFNFAQAIKKAPVICVDSPGFIVNRVLTATMSEMFNFQTENDLTPEQLDEFVVNSGLSPMGPCKLGDRLGLDTVMHVAEYLNETLGDTFTVSQQMRELVAAGNLGRKTGKGFYEYE